MGLLLFVILSLPAEVSAHQFGNLQDTLPRIMEQTETDTLVPQIRRGLIQTDTIVNDTLPFIEDIEIALLESDSIDETLDYHEKTDVFNLTAALLSPIPGLGQAIKGELWKAPVYYGGFAAIGYLWMISNNDYQRYSEAIKFRLDGDPDTMDDFPDFSLNILESQRDLYRFNMNISYGLAAGLYLYNILDATGVLDLSRLQPTPETHSPLKATMFSVVVPGMGQAYNGKSWKIPIIYGGFAMVLYAVVNNNHFYQLYRKSYFARIDGNPNTTDIFPRISTDRLERRMNFYRRNLEISYIAGAAVYILNVLDATVDAHLLDFDVGEELTMNLQPVLIPNMMMQDGNRNNSFAGLKFTFRF